MFNHVVTHIPIHSVRNSVLIHLMRIDLGAAASIHLGLRLYCRGQLSIGSNSVVDRDCTLDGRGGLQIGQNVNISPEVMVLTASHDPDDSEAFAGYDLPVIIEDYVWIATRAVILPGVTIGYGSIVAAGSIVTTDVPCNVIVAGNPARQIRERRTDGLLSYQLNYRRLFH
jgi:acetyltransferase-like isoleucine patch superfamily enzyme